MSSDTKEKDRKEINRRQFLAAGAVGAAGIAAAGLGVNTAEAKTIIPGDPLKTNATKGGKRVIIINDAWFQIGPPLALNFAKQGYNLVLGQPAEGLVKKCESYGAKVVLVPIEQEGPNDESQPGSTQKFVDAAMKEFGGYDSAYIRTAIHTMGGIFEVNTKDMQKLYESNFLAVIYALQALLPPLMDKGAGQVLILTSATGSKPFSDALGYSCMRAAANMAVKCASMEAAAKGVCVNAFGTNFLNYPDAVKAVGGKEAMAEVAKHIPVGRFGEPEEAAHLAMALLDGYNMYSTGSFFPVAGGYNNAIDTRSFK